MQLSDKYSLYQLEKNGRRLEVGCYNCGNVIRIRPSWTSLRPHLKVSEAADRLSCYFCGKSNNGLYHYLYSKPARRD
jgi:hypothetical protein